MIFTFRIRNRQINVYLISQFFSTGIHWWIILYKLLLILLILELFQLEQKNEGCLDIQRFNKQDTWSIVLDKGTNLSVLGHVVCVGEVSLEDDLGLTRRLAKLVQHVQLVRAVLADVGGQHVLFRHLCKDSKINTGLLLIPFEKKSNYQDFKISVGLPYLIFMNI